MCNPKHFAGARRRPYEQAAPRFRLWSCFKFGSVPAVFAETSGDMRRIVALAVAMTAPAAVASADLVQTPGSNIVVTTCHGQIGKPPLRIAYKNDSQKTAKEVDFSVTDAAGLVRTVRDVGTFEAGAQINHVFDLPPDVSPLGLSSANCIVTKVTYADGTSWTNPNPP